MRSQVTLLLLCILGATIALDANQLIIQQALNGVFEENNLVDPSTVMACIDSDTAAKVVAFVPKFFKKASSLFTIAGAISDAESFASTLNPQVGTCLKDNVEMLALIADYDISKINKTTAIAYVTSHASTFTNEFAQAYKEFTSGQYNTLGNELGAFAHKILSAISSKVKAFLLQATNDANQDIIQQAINGFFEQNNLADPTTIVPCIDTTTAGQVVAFVPGFLKKLSSALTLPSALTSLQSFVQTLNPQVATCLQGNTEAAELATVFDISGVTQSAAISWATGHISTVTGEASTLNKLWSSGSYNAFGNNVSSFAHTVLKQIVGKNAINGVFDTMQEFYNGIYSQQGLSNPTFIAQCYPEAAVAEFVAFAPTFLKKASSALNIKTAFADLQTFAENQGKNYPSIAECLQGNTQLTDLSTAIGVKNPATVQSTIQSYIEKNIFSTNSAFGDAYKSWDSKNFTKSGQQVSAWVKKALANNKINMIDA